MNPAPETYFSIEKYYHRMQIWLPCDGIHLSREEAEFEANEMIKLGVDPEDLRIEERPFLSTSKSSL